MLQSVRSSCQQALNGTYLLPAAAAQVLVTTSTSFVNAHQEEPYGDIHISRGKAIPW